MYCRSEDNWQQMSAERRSEITANGKPTVELDVRASHRGYGVAVVTQILIFPVFGLHTTLAQNMKMSAVFTVVSIARSFALRRLFEAIRMRGD